ncbi:MAG: hypothetical protein JNM94_09630 [Phycisphaerae bacterium]|nr:hypothetical protein [Phycisphaerae bacterium]
MNETSSRVYHCYSRCVRKMALLDRPGRREWIAKRIETLTRYFAIDVVDYAIEANHFHDVLRTHPELAWAWSDEEVAERWLTLMPNWTVKRVLGQESELPSPEEIAIACSDPALTNSWRQRLCDLGWFHRLIKEPCARLWNKEDGVNGHFWQGPYCSIACGTGRDAVAVAAYVLLNPIRSGAAAELDQCEFTSMQARLRALEEEIRRGLHADAASRLAEALATPAFACDPGEETRRLGDDELALRVAYGRRYFALRDHALADAHQHRLNAERCESPHPRDEPAFDDSCRSQLALLAPGRRQSRLPSGVGVSSELSTELNESPSSFANAARETSVQVSEAATGETSQTSHAIVRREPSRVGGDSATPAPPEGKQRRSPNHPPPHPLSRAMRTRAKRRPRHELPLHPMDGSWRVPIERNRWRDPSPSPILDGLTLEGFIAFVDRLGRSERVGSVGAIRECVRPVVEKIRERVAAEQGRAPGSG